MPDDPFTTETREPTLWPRRYTDRVIGNPFPAEIPARLLDTGRAADFRRIREKLTRAHAEREAYERRLVSDLTRMLPEAVQPRTREAE